MIGVVRKWAECSGYWIFFWNFWFLKNHFLELKVEDVETNFASSSLTFSKNKKKIRKTEKDPLTL